MLPAELKVVYRSLAQYYMHDLRASSRENENIDAMHRIKFSNLSQSGEIHRFKYMHLIISII